MSKEKTILEKAKEMGLKDVEAKLKVQKKEFTESVEKAYAFMQKRGKK